MQRLTLLQWLQSQQQVELFDQLFVRCDPNYLRQTSPLVILSVGAAVTSSLATNVMERLTWLETVFHSIDTRVRCSFHILTTFLIYTLLGPRDS